MENAKDSKESWKSVAMKLSSFTDEQLIEEIKYRNMNDALNASEIELMISWFKHIMQIADDRKTGNGMIMSANDALDEIKVIAKESIEYINELGLTSQHENIK